MDCGVQWIKTLAEIVKRINESLALDEEQRRMVIVEAIASWGSIGSSKNRAEPYGQAKKSNTSQPQLPTMRRHSWNEYRSTSFT